MKRTRRLGTCAILVLALGAAACDVNLAGPRDRWQDVAGRYALRRVDGYALPTRASVPDGDRPCASGERIEANWLTSGSLELDYRDEFELVLTYVARCVSWDGWVEERPYALRLEDAYATDGERIRLYSRLSGATHARGTVDASRLRLTLPYDVFEFWR